MMEEKLVEALDDAREIYLRKLSFIKQLAEADDMESAKEASSQFYAYNQGALMALALLDTEESREMRDGLDAMYDEFSDLVDELLGSPWPQCDRGDDADSLPF